MGISALKVNNKIISDAKEKVEALSDQFATVFSRENTEDEIPILGEECNLEEIPQLVNDADGVCKQLKAWHLAPGKAPSPDQIPP